MGVVTYEEFQEVLREYLKDRVNAPPFSKNKERFAKEAKIPKPSIVNAYNRQRGVNVTIDMLIRIAKNIGPRFDVILSEIADRCRTYENRVERGEIVETPTAKAMVRSENAAEVKETIAKLTRPSGKQHDGRPERARPAKPRHPSRHSR